MLLIESNGFYCYFCPVCKSEPHELWCTWDVSEEVDDLSTVLLSILCVTLCATSSDNRYQTERPCQVNGAILL